MPAKSAAQQRLMQAAAHTKGGYGGVPQKVGKEFVGDWSLRSVMSCDTFNESDHPRAPDGKFGNGSGGGTIKSNFEDLGKHNNREAAPGSKRSKRPTWWRCSPMSILR